MKILDWWYGRKDEEKLHRLERQAAKRWVKHRLLKMFPELQKDPKALEELYRGLSLEPRPGVGRGGTTAFEIVLPEKYRI